jgi:hypothetical protein
MPPVGESSCNGPRIATLAAKGRDCDRRHSGPASWNLIDRHLRRGHGAYPTLQDLLQ